MAVGALGCHPTHTNDTHMASLPNLFQYPQLHPQCQCFHCLPGSPSAPMISWCFHDLPGSTAVSTMPVFPLPPRIHSCIHDFTVFLWPPRIHSCIHDFMGFLQLPRIHICTHDFMVFSWSRRIHSCHPWGHNVSLAYSSLAQGLLLHTAILFTYNPHLLYFEQFKTFFVQGLRFWMCSILPKTREVPRNWSEGRTKEYHFCPLSLTAWVECSAHNGHLKGTSWVKKMEK